MRKILLADDHAVIRKGLRTILEKDIPGSVIIEARDGLETVDLARRFRPEMAILDIGMPGLNGLEAIRQILHHQPGIKIMILSIHKGKDFVIEALRQGAAAYLLKECAVEELVDAIKAVFDGKKYLSPPLRNLIPSDHSKIGAAGTKSELEKLSPREREVLGLLAEGNSNREIAEKLYLSPETVKTHRKHIMKKLDIHNLTALIRFALDNRLNPRLEPPPL